MCWLSGLAAPPPPCVAAWGVALAGARSRQSRKKNQNDTLPYDGYHIIIWCRGAAEFFAQLGCRPAVPPSSEGVERGSDGPVSIHHWPRC